MKGLLADARETWHPPRPLGEGYLSGREAQTCPTGLAAILAAVRISPEPKAILKRVLQSDPNSWHAHNYCPVVCVRQGGFQEAVTHAERSLELGKSLANSVRLTLAEALMAQDQRERAAARLQGLLEGRPPPAQREIANGLLRN